MGLFSHMPIILGIDLVTMLQELPLSPNVHKALASHVGVLGQLLEDVEAFEQGALLAAPADLMLQAAAEARTLMDSQLS